MSYRKHGFGATLHEGRWNAADPIDVVDVDFGDEGVVVFDPWRIRRFAESIALPAPTRVEIESACANLVSESLIRRIEGKLPQWSIRT